MTQPDLDETRAWRIAVITVALLTLVRLIVLFATPLELYPDEAQYWLWSRHLAFGYFSKPPVIAWLIWLTTSVGGNAEPFVRLAAPILHAGTALALYGVGARLYGARAGIVACLVYSLMPGVQLSSGVISTDAPLLFFLSLALLAYAFLQTKRSLGSAIGIGAALGMAMLSKYAAVYAIGGIVLHLIFSREARQAWSWRTALTATAAFAAVLTPNVLWNAQHHFSTLEHTASNADWGHQIGGLAELGDFLGSQFGVFGPLPFAVLIGGAVVLAARKRLAKEDILLLCWTLPALIVVAAQAFISRSNANWAASSYVAGSVLVAAWLLRWRAKWWLIAGLGLQALVAAVFLLWAANPRAADAMGAANSFKRARGWEDTVESITRLAAADPGVTAVAVDNRFLFNEAGYYGRDFFSQPGAPPLRMWVSGAVARNQAEAEAPLTPQLGARVVGASYEGVYRDRMIADFEAAKVVEIARVRLDAKHARRTELLIGEGFTPKPR